MTVRGRPVIQWILFTLAWLALVWPITRVTRATAPAVSSPAPGATAVVEQAPVWLTMRFSVAPESFTVRQGERDLWSEKPTGERQFDREVALVADALGVEFSLVAVLPDGDAVVEVTVEPDGGRAQSKTLWVNGSFEEAVAFDRVGP